MRAYAECGVVAALGRHLLFESARGEMEKKGTIKEHGSEGGKGCDWEGA